MGELKRKAITGFFWQAFGLFGQQGVAFVASIVFARLLAPADYGVVSLAVAVILFTEIVRSGGLLQAFTTYQGDAEAAKHTVLWICVASGVLFFAILFVGAPVAADALNAPLLTPILRALALTQVFDSFSIVPQSMMLRKLMFRELSLAQTLPFLIGAAVGIALLFFLQEPDRLWALVALYLARSLSTALFSNLYHPLMPRLQFEPRLGRDITLRGLAILASNLPASATEPITLLAVGGRAGKEAAGFFNLANNMMMPASKIAHAANTTLFPILAQHATDPERLRNYVLRAFKTLGVLWSGILAWLIVASPDLTPLLFGSKWVPAVPLSQWLALATMLRLYAFVASAAMIAVGKTRFSVVTWSVTLTAACVLLFAWPVSFGDAEPIAATAAMFYGLGFVVGLLSISLALGIRLTNLLVALLPAAASCSAGLLAAWTLTASGTLDAWPIARLAGITLAFALVFLPICGKMMGGGWTSLFKPAGVRGLLRVN